MSLPSTSSASARPSVDVSHAHVVSLPVPDQGDLLTRLPSTDSLCWTRGSDGFVAWGEFARLEVTGPQRFETAAAWWADIVASCEIDDQVTVPGSGPVAFASFTFDDGPAESVVVVPRVVVGRRDGACWITTFDGEQTHAVVEPIEPPGAIRYSDGHLSTADYEVAVQKAVDLIAGSDLDKVVLAQDLIATSTTAIDARALLQPLAREFPSCWTFAIDGLVGATQKLLVRRTGDHIVSRVLAGTSTRSVDAVVDAQHAAELLASEKDRVEHQLAVQSVAEALAPYCSDLVVPRAPEVVRLANVQHLQTDVTGRLANGETALDLAASLHPTAAVCGTPTKMARRTIRELEGMDRGRYAGPVGWLDSRGDGAFGIALRCAQIRADDPNSARMFAGCGIVSGSQPLAELHEAQTKLLAIRDALENRENDAFITPDVHH